VEETWATTLTENSLPVAKEFETNETADDSRRVSTDVGFPDTEADEAETAVGKVLKVAR
jgi:hypothetical protein